MGLLDLSVLVLPHSNPEQIHVDIAKCLSTGLPTIQEAFFDDLKLFGYSDLNVEFRGLSKILSFDGILEDLTKKTIRLQLQGTKSVTIKTEKCLYSCLCSLILCG